MDLFDFTIPGTFTGWIGIVQTVTIFVLIYKLHKSSKIIDYLNAISNTRRHEIINLGCAIESQKTAIETLRQTNEELLQQSEKFKLYTHKFVGCLKPLVDGNFFGIPNDLVDEINNEIESTAKVNNDIATKIAAFSYDIPRENSFVTAEQIRDAIINTQKRVGNKILWSNVETVIDKSDIKRLIRKYDKTVHNISVIINGIKKTIKVWV